MHLYDRDICLKELEERVGRLEQAAGVRLLRIEDGPGRGVRLLEFDCGHSLVFDVLIDRAFDIGRCLYRGIPLAWISPVGEAGPWYREVTELGFLRTFGGGLLTTAGLDHTLFPTTDDATRYGYTPRALEHYPLHGRLSTLPSRLIGYGMNRDGEECVLFGEAEVEQTSVFGERLVLRRRIEATVGGSSLRIVDRVTNAGYAVTPHMLLYHVNVGYPIVDDGSLLLAATSRVRARGPYSTEGYARFGPPSTGAQEQVFEQTLRPGPEGEAALAIANPRLALGVYQRYPNAKLPHNFLWRMLGPTHYVVGIEPSTNAADGRTGASARGELIELQPGEARTYFLELGVLPGAEALQRFAHSIDADQAGELEKALM